MAGQFVSVTDVSDRAQFMGALSEVVASAHLDGERVPMAVLVQRQLEPIVSGVLFTVDPTSPSTKGFAVSYVDGPPSELVGGVRNGRGTRLGRHGRRIDGTSHDEALTKRRCRQLAALARRTESLFDSPQDIEWAFDENDDLRLLQSRPITTVPSKVVPYGPVFGAGPVAETFPEPLTPLEVDMWVKPMAEGLRATMSMLCVASQAQLDASPIVTDHDGWVVCDLDLLDPAPPSTLRRIFDPVPTIRRLRVAWRMGRLRAALPLLARAAISRADAALTAVDHPSALTPAQLAAVIENGRRSLVALHAQESAAGVFLNSDAPPATSAQAAALRVVADCRDRGLDDRRILETEPVTLSLFSPAVYPDDRHLPHDPEHLAAPEADPPDSLPILREALKLRIRWTQEVMAACVRELAGRLTAARRLEHQRLVVELAVDDLVTAALTQHAPVDVTADGRPDVPGPPARFRYSRTGDLIPQRDERAGHAVGVSGGRINGSTWDLADGPPPPDRVLVTPTMDPRLAQHLQQARGLVSESGSSLSHLAILARELGVPAVAQVTDACDRFPSGTDVCLDGWEGSVARREGVAP